MKKVNRIPIFIASLFVIGMGGYLMTWSYFRASLSELFPTWSDSQLSLPFSIMNVTVCLMMLFTGPILLKISSRKVISFGGLCLLIGFGMYAFLPTGNPSAALVMAVVGFGVLASISVGIGVIAGYDTFLPWFPERPGFMSGILTFWCGVVPILTGALCGVFIKGFGVLIAVGLIGLILAIVVFASVPWSARPGNDIKLPPPPKAKKEELIADYTPTQMLRTGTFYCVFIFNLAIRSAGLIMMDRGGSIAEVLGVATIIGLVFAPVNGFACILGGIMMDKLKMEVVMMIMAIAAAAGGVALLIGEAAGSVPLVILGIALVGGFSYGGVTVTGVNGTRVLFGMKHYARNLGIISVSIGPAAIAVYFAGKLSMNGIYMLVTILGVIAVASIAAMFVTERTRKRKLTERREDNPQIRDVE